MKQCANGCNAPVHPPSKVICKSCMDKITRRLEEWAARSEAESTNAVRRLAQGDTQ
jgi:hypothetical protein